MKRTAKLLATTLLTAGLVVAGAALASPAEQPLPIPPALQVQLGDILDQLSAVADKPAPVGAQARQMRALLQAHMKYIEDVILPPLSLLPTIVATDVAPDMKWALPLVERAKAEHGRLTQAHAQLTDQLVLLFTAAQQADDAQTARLAQDIAAYLQGESDVIEPAVQLIGKYLRLRLGAGS